MLRILTILSFGLCLVPIPFCSLELSPQTTFSGSRHKRFCLERMRRQYLLPFRVGNINMITSFEFETSLICWLAIDIDITTRNNTTSNSTDKGDIIYKYLTDSRSTGQNEFEFEVQWI